MSTLTLTPLPAQPIRPASYDELILRSNAAVAAYRAAARKVIRGQDTSDRAIALLRVARERQAECNAWWQTPDGVAYREAVDAYETARVVRAAERRAGAQASVNRRAVTAVRAAACPLCFATHRGEC